MNISRKIQTVWRLPLVEKLWFLFFYPYSGLVRAALLTFPFKLLSRVYGEHHQNYEFSPVVTEQERMLAWRIGRIAELAAKYTPWESKCLVQAVMVRTLLGLYGIPYAMHLGARITSKSEEPMKAHAWVKVGSWIISGKDGHRAYAIVSTFVAPSILKTSSQSTT